MSNFEKSCKLASEWVDSMGGLEAVRHDYGSDLSGLMQALEDAGLLMPDMPEPDSHDEHGWPEWGDTEYMTYFSEHPCKGIPYISTPLSPWMDAESVRKEAYRLLAAAEWLDEWDKEHAEKEQGNE